ncbi:MAG TPA: hypothetical protein VNT50_02715 [Microbacterium sp.]|uniref:DUF6993 domain-containing protein n=1 Tax=Microbacterium sp. TaxID=51671 RepID=UPI002C1BE649|nr:hypothetical protein [Microbacterium sp.]HWI30375.1 hypothetical protein [Microbacterium sp.]
MTRRPDRRRAVLVFAGLALSSTLGLAGCSAPAPAPTTSAVPSGTGSTEPTPSATPSISEPVLAPDGSAADNLPLFRAVTEQVWATDARDQGRAYVDALAAAGFDKAGMQVTADVSTVGNAAESIQFSVLWGAECLIGQVGPATGAPVAIVARALEGGVCLVGNTRPIDW